MAEGIKNVSAAHPCPICGKPDWCFSKPSGDGELYYCARAADSPVVANGEVYLLQRMSKEDFGVYETERQQQAARRRWVEEQRKLGRNINYSGKSTSLKNVSTKPREEVYPTEEKIPVASTARLNEVYSAFLGFCILEEQHKMQLQTEWYNKEYQDEHIFESLIEQYPIKSIPPEDHARIESGMFLKNLFRKKIMEKLVEQVGEPLGVPGFYQKENGSWTFYWLSGMAFPIYNSKGEIIRIRIRDDFATVSGSYKEQEGEYLFNRKDGSWYFIPIVDGKRIYPGEIVYNAKKGIKNITLVNYKPMGKVNGKYKNFSSYAEYRDDEKKLIRNRFLNGCQSESYISLYCQPDDNFSVVYFTEGEKKGMVSDYCLKSPCVTVPGVSTFSKIFEKEDGMETSMLDYLLSKGMQLAVMCYDADKTVNEKVLRSEQKAIARLKEAGVAVAIGEWNINFGKGLDDILIAHLLPKFIPVI